MLRDNRKLMMQVTVNFVIGAIMLGYAIQNTIQGNIVAAWIEGTLYGVNVMVGALALALRYR